MATKELITRVWIAPGCIVCDACETTCPDVFHVTEDSCLIRPEALNAEFTKPITDTIIEAAEECPVEVIKFETITVDAADVPPPPVTAKSDGVVASASAPASSVVAKAPTAATHAGEPVGVVDPAIQALLRATTARGGRAVIDRGGVESPAAVKALRSKKLDDLPPDARNEKMIEATKVEKAAAKVSRRAVISAAGVGWVAFAGSSAVGGAVLQRFMMPNVLEEPDPRIRLGPLSQYAEMAVGSVSEDYKLNGIWIVRLEGEIAALSTTCTHLGCIPNWLAADRKFKCPCHGSGFMQSGINFEGPAPRPLERYRVLVEDGVVVIDRSKKFQQEKGEWTNPESFITV